MERQVYAVSEINQLIKTVMDSVPQLGNLCVRGEISNYKLYPSGHHYFTLKDADGALKCVMFRGQAGRLRFRPENGMKVLATGRITVFPRDGAYQLYCDALSPDGVGDLHAAFEHMHVDGDLRKGERIQHLSGHGECHRRHAQKGMGFVRRKRACKPHLAFFQNVGMFFEMINDAGVVIRIAATQPRGYGLAHLAKVIRSGHDFNHQTIRFDHAAKLGIIRRGEHIQQNVRS